MEQNNKFLEECDQLLIGGLVKETLEKVISNNSPDDGVIDDAKGLLSRWEYNEKDFTLKGISEYESYSRERIKIGLATRKLLNTYKQVENNLKINISASNSQQASFIRDEIFYLENTKTKEYGLIWYRYSFVALVLLPIVFLSILASLALYKEKHINPFVIISQIIIFTVVLFWYYWIERKVKKSFDTTELLPFPNKYWRFRFNQIPTYRELSQNLSIKILIIYATNSILNDESKEIFERIEQNFLSIDSTVKVDGVNCSTIQGDSLKIQLQDKKEVFGIYLLFSKTLKDLTWPEIYCKEWAKNNRDKPIIYVDLCKGKNDLNFPKEEKEQAIEGIWGLFTRSSRRAAQWEEQSNINHKYFRVLFFPLFFIFNLLLFLSIIQKNIYYDDLGHMNRPLSMEGADRLAENLRPIKKLLENKLSNSEMADAECYEALNKSAEYILLNLLKSQGLEYDPQKVKLSYWKMQNDTIFEFAWSSTTSDKIGFNPKSESIISCSFSHENKFILWKENMTQDESACWDDKGIVAGRWDKSLGKIVMGGDSFCGYTPSTKNGNKEKIKIEALLCFSNGNSGIGIDIRDGYDTNFLSTQFTRNVLINTLTLVDLVPQKAVKTRFTQYY